MKTKICSAKCSLVPQPIKNFNFRNRLKGIRHSYCRECGKKKTRRHYLLNSKYYKDKARAREKQIVVNNQEFVFQYLSSHPCVDCGEIDPIVLEFDHIKGKKLECISTMVQYAYHLKAIVREIKKCVVRCCNCHRRITSKRGGHFRTLRAISSIALEHSATN